MHFYVSNAHDPSEIRQTASIFPVKLPGGILTKRDTLPSMTWPCFVDKNGKTTNLSTNSPDFMDRCVILLRVSTKTGVFMDKVAELMVLSMKREVFMDETIAQKRDTLRKDVSVKLLSISRLTNFVCFPPSHLGKTSKLDCTRFVVGYLLSAVATSTAQATFNLP